MDVVLYGIVAVVWWILSMTVLLPFMLLLIFSKSIRSRWFSWVFLNIFGLLMKSGFFPLRRRAFAILKEGLASGPKRNSPLEILEIGIGSGTNLEFYPENSNLTALDMNKAFEVNFHQNLKKFSHVVHKRTVIAMAENMPQVEDSSMDVVVCTFVLCSVESIDAVLTQVKRVLKPGGRFLFVEHVAFPKDEWGYILQRLVSPLWRLNLNGCIPDRDIAAEIKRAGFSEVLCENFITDSILYFIRPRIVGVATK